MADPELHDFFFTFITGTGRLRYRGKNPDEIAARSITQSCFPAKSPCKTGFFLYSRRARSHRTIPPPIRGSIAPGLPEIY
jgi:hypothetical protein